MDSPADYRLFSKREYLAELTQRFDGAGAGSRILLMAMTFEPDLPQLAEVFAALEGAAGRGADITLMVDARSFMDPNHRPAGPTGQLGPLWYRRQLPAQLKPPYKARGELLNIINYFPNARAVIINKPTRQFSVPVAGRSHIKAAIIDDFVITGGCNLDHPEYSDLMVGWQDQRTADALYRILSRIADTGNARQAMNGRDLVLPVSDNSKILIDAGVRGRSLIFKEALKLIDSAQEWLTITCQFFPNSITARHLLAARKRGVKLDIIFSDPRHHGLVGGQGQKFSIALEKSRLPADMFTHMLGTDVPMVHAKVIACDTGVMIGSHNYVRAGVRLGTAEIALQSTDAELTQNTCAAILRQLPITSNLENGFSKPAS